MARKIVTGIAVSLFTVLFVLSVLLNIYLIDFMDDLYVEIDEKSLSLNEAVEVCNQYKTKLSEANTTIVQQQSESSELQNNLNQITAKLEISQAREESYQEMIEKYEDLTTECIEIAEKNKYFFYYVTSEQQFGINNLSYTVNYLEWLKDYQVSVFDCSEMASSLERELENDGFHTLIAIGNTPGDPDTRHAWLLVETREDEYTPVEATIPWVVKSDYPDYDEYFNYEQTFETIQEAMEYQSTEFDWWTD